MSYGIGCRHGSDPTLLWLWLRPVATVRIQPLAWELPYAASAALKSQKQTNKIRSLMLASQQKRETEGSIMH